MGPRVKWDAIVIGSGPNGLAAAITLARAGRSVLVREAAAVAGGGARTEALTLPGFRHDTFSACHPLGVASPFFRELRLERHGLEWLSGGAAAAHPLDEGPAPLLKRSVDETADTLGEEDAENYRRFMKPLVRHGEALLFEILQPPWHLPRHPLLLARFGLSALRSAAGLAEARFRGERARALFAGIASHATTPLTWRGSAAPGLVLNLAAHLSGWPIPRGGAGEVARALVAELERLGGRVETGAPVTSLAELPEHGWLFFDLTPRQILRLAGPRLPHGYARALERFRYGPGVFKMDWALSGPIPWKSPECARAATVHLCGTLKEQIESERAPIAGEIPARPYVLLVQPSLFDPTRAPEGKHTAWAYCHVPNGSRKDMTAKIEAQLERFAPGFGRLVLARSALTTAELEARNANLVGGDLGGGLSDLAQLLRRPTIVAPYCMPAPGGISARRRRRPGRGCTGCADTWLLGRRSSSLPSPNSKRLGTAP